MQLFKKKLNNKKIIIFIGMEGWSKKGGQGDYIRELSEAMGAKGHTILVINPYYNQSHADISTDKGELLCNITLPVGQGFLPFEIYHNRVGTVHYLRFKDPSKILFPVVYPDWHINGNLYSDSLYGYVEAVALSRIAMHIAKELDIKPDILHFNDWQSAYGPPYMEIIYKHHDDFKELFKKTGTIITTHNIAYQGLTKWGLSIDKNNPITELLKKIFPEDGLFIAVYDHGYVYEVDAFALTGLPRYFQFMPEGGAECWSDVPGYGGRHNVLKFGLEKANKIITVSKGNYQDIQRDDLSFGLGPVVAARAWQGAVHYVWNGIDVKNLSPRNLPEFTEHVDKKKQIRFVQFSADDQDLFEKRLNNKIAVRAKINHLIKSDPDSCFGKLDESRADDLLTSAVSRLVRQKGFGILFQPLEYNYELGIYHGERLADVLMRLRSSSGNKLQLVFMGTSGDGDGAWVLERLKDLAYQYEGQVAVICRFDSALANQIRAGSDLFFMPSQYEPGGISNIQAAIVGALCILTYTGGLIDFIEAGGTRLDFVSAGFGYDVPWTLQQTAQDFVRSFKKAINLFYENTSQWHEQVRRTMRINVDWSSKVADYISIYDAAQKQV